MGVFGFVYFVMPNNGCEAIIFFRGDPLAGAARHPVRLASRPDR
jgi:hypothetical protein